MQRALSSILNHLQLIKRLGNAEQQAEAERIEAVLHEKFTREPEAVNFATAEEDQREGKK